ncbi:nickel-dependent lactate racemase [Hydrogenispora ethanolica]|uniref:nickel-dependent lactate racemase n=1 Tax=Hydrogenispora ethanolica TaxID=1082276 RepID=UPI0024362E38|nr:nickel-dependent lactate racemase [Hydrogenispora ethanolica]
MEFAVPDRNLLYYAAPAAIAACGDQDRLISEALDQPIGAGRLEETIPVGAKVLIIIDDITRPTPQQRILPHVLRRIEQAAPRQIKLMIAPGTHRPLTEAELLQKVGPAILGRYEIINPNYQESHFHYLNTTELGTPVEVYPEVLESDFKIAIGNIVPHVVVGWSGGAKMIQPGVCGKRTTDYTHWIGAVKTDLMGVCGAIDNLCRAEIDRIGEMVGLDFIINTVLDEERNILKLFAGHFLEAHRAGVRFADQVLRPEIPELADILVVSANPCFIDYWQGFKPFAFAQFGVKKGGTIIFVLDAPEGLCGNAPSHQQAVYEGFRMTPPAIIDGVNRGAIRDIVGATNPLNHFKLIDRADVICVSQYLTEEELRLLRFRRANDVNAALEMAFERHGADAKVGIIPYGGETLVRLKTL